MNRGITELILHDNNLGKSFIDSMSMRIHPDEVLRFIDLRHNNLNSKLIMKMLRSILTNKTIVGIDVRGNKGYHDNGGVKLSIA